MWQTKNSPVDRLVVPLRGNDFGCKIIRRSAKSPGNIGHFLCEAKIGDLEVAMAIQKQIFGLQVAVDDVLLMQIIECERDLSSIKLGHGVREALSMLDPIHVLDKVIHYSPEISVAS